MMRFEGKVIAVTGGASGLGEAIVRRIAEENGRVAILDTDQARAEEIAAELPKAKAFTADVTDPSGLTSVFDEVVDWAGRLDGAVNNAGVGGPFAATVDYPLEWWEKTLAVNLSGVFYSMRAEIPHLIESGGGSIVNMASVRGFVGQAGTAAYAAAKHGILGLTKSVAWEYGRDGVRCTAVCPTLVRTPLTMATFQDEETWKERDERHATGRVATAEEVAAITAFLLSDEAKSITGSAHLIDGGLTAI